MRHQFLAGIFIAMVAGYQVPTVAQQSNTQPKVKVKHLIDTHIHLYDTARDVYDPNQTNPVPWPPANDRVLHKPHLPAEFHKVAEPAGVTGVVIVEASPRLDDNDWVLKLVDNDDFFIGLVGNLDPLQSSFRKNLDRLKANPRFVGIRFHLMNREEGISSDPQLLTNLRDLADANLALDVLMNQEGPKTIDEVGRIAEQIPNLRIVVNHVLGYNIDGKHPNQTWINAVQRLAQKPNVSVKISGLYQRSTTQPAPQSIDYFQSVLDVLWDAFGSDRLIYGSNWPVTKKTGNYTSFVLLVSAYFADKGQAATESFFWQNAAKAYGLNLK